MVAVCVSHIRIPHPNLLRPLGVIMTGDTLSGTLFPYMPDDLHRFWSHHRGYLPWPIVKAFTRDLLSAVAHLHGHSISHRDVKPGNCLIGWPGSGPAALVLADFGWCKEAATDLMTPGAVTMPYRAPEVELGSRKYNHTVDLWSVGIVLFELLVGSRFFTGGGKKTLWVAYVSLVGPIDEATWPGVSVYPMFPRCLTATSKLKTTAGEAWRTASRRFYPESGQRLAEGCLRLVPGERVEARDSLRHPFLADAPPLGGGPSEAAADMAFRWLFGGSPAPAGDVSGLDDPAKAANTDAAQGGALKPIAHRPQEVGAAKTGAAPGDTTTCLDGLAGAVSHGAAQGGGASKPAANDAQGAGKPQRRRGATPLHKKPAGSFCLRTAPRIRIRSKMANSAVRRVREAFKVRKRPAAAAESGDRVHVDVSSSSATPAAEAAIHVPSSSAERPVEPPPPMAPSAPGVSASPGSRKRGRGDDTGDAALERVAGTGASGPHILQSPWSLPPTPPTAARFTGKSGQERCACKGFCQAYRMTAHGCGKGLTLECPFAASSGSSYCEVCKCQVAGCSGLGAERVGTCRKFEHACRPYGAPFRATIVFAESLVKMEPVDLQEFLRQAKGMQDILQLSLLADVWEPTACALLADSFRKLPRDYSAQAMADCFHRCFEELGTFDASSPPNEAAEDESPRSALHRSELSVRNIGGMARHFGCKSLARRLQIVPSAKAAAMSKAKAAPKRGPGLLENLLSAKTTVGDAAWRKAQKAAKEGKPSETWDALGDFVTSTHIPLGMMWGRAKNGYHAGHITRKLWLTFYHAHPQEHWYNRQRELMLTNVDVNGHCTQLPRYCFSRPGNLHRMCRPIDPTRLSMWACLLNIAFRDVKGFQEGFEAGHITLKHWEAAREQLSARLGHSPHPKQVAECIMEGMQSGEPQASGGAPGPAA